MLARPSLCTPHPQGLALVSTRLLSQLRESREQSSYCAHLPAGLPADELEVDCDALSGKLGWALLSGLAGMLSMWAAAFVSHRLSENIQDRDVSAEDARLVELILRVKAELQVSALQ